MDHTPVVPVVIVAAMEKHSRAIGHNNALLWHVPADLKRFKALTLGQPVIMGRKTFESIIDILGKPLPGRTNIVVTRNADYSYAAANVAVVSSLSDAFKRAEAESPTEIHIGGGAQLYAEALPFTQRLHITFFDDETVVADTFFPDFTEQFTIAKMYPEANHVGLKYQWIDFKRVTDIE